MWPMNHPTITGVAFYHKKVVGPCLKGSIPKYFATREFVLLSMKILDCWAIFTDLL